ncbi:MAG: hypothetical protein WKG01_33815 [Kofleriaceae bacterium]
MSSFERLTFLAASWLLATACRSHEPARVVQPVAPQPALPVDRIAIVGASVSAGFGGMPFGDAFVQAAPRSRIDAAANVMLFRDPIGDSRTQIDRAIAFRATTVVALDFLFWDVYGSQDPAWRERALAAGLGELERARTAGAWILVGDIPLVTTASELLLPRANVPEPAALAAANATIAAWAKRDRVLYVPFASWAEPLAKQGDIELAPGERVPARTLVAADGLHANELGVWALLDRLDKLIEAALPGTPRSALVFVRPTRRAE